MLAQACLETNWRQSDKPEILTFLTNADPIHRPIYVEGLQKWDSLMYLDKKELMEFYAKDSNDLNLSIVRSFSDKSFSTPEPRSS